MVFFIVLEDCWRQCVLVAGCVVVLPGSSLCVEGGRKLGQLH